jgi:hypothetical protein
LRRDDQFTITRGLAIALATEASAGLIPLEDDYYNRNLTCPAKGLDYLAHGLPTIASDLPSTRSLFGSSGAARYGGGPVVPTESRLTTISSDIYLTIYTYENRLE